MRYLLMLLMIQAVWSAPIDKTIDELLEGNQENSLGVSEYDPFSRAKPLLYKKMSKRSIQKKAALALSAVLNDRAYMNGKWYTKGDLTPEGRVIRVKADAVYLKKGTKIKVLTLHNQKSMFSIREKDHQ